MFVYVKIHHRMATLVPNIAQPNMTPPATASTDNVQPDTTPLSTELPNTLVPNIAQLNMTPPATASTDNVQPDTTPLSTELPNTVAPKAMPRCCWVM